MINICTTVVLLLLTVVSHIRVVHHCFFLAVRLTYITMNIQPADRLRLFGGILQLQNERLMQIVAVLDLAHHGRCRRPVLG